MIDRGRIWVTLPRGGEGWINWPNWDSLPYLISRGESPDLDKSPDLHLIIAKMYGRGQIT